LPARNRRAFHEQEVYMKGNANTVNKAESISAAIDACVGLICAILFGGMTFIVILGVFFRYVLSSPLNWVEETSRYLMIWGASLAISLGVSAGEHVGLTVILDALKKPYLRKILATLVNLLVLAFLVFMFAYSLAATAESRFQMSQALGITMFIPKMAVPIAMGLGAIQTILVSVMILASPDGRRSQGVGYIDI
jgi:TRAP-type C4-dicarboxylate transport system permease small subunit